jgi:hypothetical protein
MNGASEFGPYDLQTGFRFEGELVEMFWRTNRKDEVKSMIEKGFEACRFGDVVTGMRNATWEGKRSDDFVHPEMFSRWILNGALIEAGIKFDDVVVSGNGHLLKMSSV